MFEKVTRGPRDLMFELKVQADGDESPLKVDLGVGVYRNEFGQYHELETIRKAKILLDKGKLGHDYNLTTGNERLLLAATKLLFGSASERNRSHQIASVQTIGGTGANHLGALFLRRCYQDCSPPAVYVGTPAWGNYEPLFQLAELPVTPYRFYDPLKRGVDFRSTIETVQNAAEGSIFVLQACCHNPTGADLTREQWARLAHEMKIRKHFPFFDSAYQGFGDGVEEDAAAVRLFADMGFEMIVCQSFSKNMGLYSERIGVLHVVARDQQSASNVKDQLRGLIRWEFSSSPSYGARLVHIILDDRALADEWSREVSSMRNRLHRNRILLHDLLVQRQTPGIWSQILNEKGLFSFLPLTVKQCESLSSEFHIHLPTSGRINVAGLNEACVERVASAIDQVVRRAQDHGMKSERD